MMQRQLFRRLNESRDQGFTIMEIVIALFVLSFGLFGILAMFPVGLRSTRNNVDKTNSSLLSESVVAYLQLAPELTTRFPSFSSSPTDNEQRIANADRTGICNMSTSTTQLKCFDDSGAMTWDAVNNNAGTPGQVSWANHALLILSGRYSGKVFRIENNTGANTLTVDTTATGAKAFDIEDKGDGYFITDGTGFAILGTISDPTSTPPEEVPDSDNVIPGDLFYASAENPATMPGMMTVKYARTNVQNNPIRSFMKIYSLEEYPEDSGEYPLNYGTEDSTDFENQSEYTWAAILSDPDAVNSNTVRVDILIFRNYNTERRPDDPSQNPPVDVITTFLTDLQ